MSTLLRDPQTDDERERHLWHESRRYMGGQISVEQLEDVERSHVQDLRAAVIELAKRKHKLSWSEAADEQERRLWTASRRYMSGEIDVKILEEVERSHTRELRKALVGFGRMKLRWRFLGILRGHRRLAGS